jgi:hypothetical protein
VILWIRESGLEISYAEGVTRKLEIFALGLALTVSLARAQTIENGLYAIVDSGGAVVKTFDGADIHLGEKLSDKIEKAVAYSLSNDNDLFSLQLWKTTGFSRDYDSIALCLSGLCLRFNGGGIGPGANMIEARNAAPAAEAAFVKFFGIIPVLHANPGFALAVRFVATKASYLAGMPIRVSLEIKNVGVIPATFRIGSNEGYRDQSFIFAAHGAAGAVPNSGNAHRFGGLGSNRTLRPGETYKNEDDLGKSFAFTRIGEYTIDTTYRLTFYNPMESGVFPVWEDEATSEFTITIR